MIDIQKIAREAGLHLPYWGDEQDPKKDPPRGWTQLSAGGLALKRFAALYREALIAELIAGSVEPEAETMPHYMPYYTADQLAGAVLRERERCAKICDSYAEEGWSTNGCATAIRSGE